MKNKSDAKHIFLQFKLIVENLTNKKIKTFQSDWGGGYRSLTPIFVHFGIKFQTSLSSYS